MNFTHTPQETLVMKFGGASVETPQHFSRVADIIMAREPHVRRIVVVVSAMKGMTDSLIDLAKQVHPEPPQREHDMLVSTGERISMALLAMSLCLKGCTAVSFTGSQSGIITSPAHTQAKIVDVRPHRIEKAFEEKKVVIVAGFQGVSEHKEITTLGRGGSDTTAVALGIALRADRVEFFKDVSGVYPSDPKKNLDLCHYPHLSYDEALRIVEGGAKVLHPRAVHLAKKNKLLLQVRSFLEEGEGTFIGHPATLLDKGLYEEL